MSIGAKACIASLRNEKEVRRAYFKDISCRYFTMLCIYVFVIELYISILF